MEPRTPQKVTSNGWSVLFVTDAASARSRNVTIPQLKQNDEWCAVQDSNL